MSEDLSCYYLTKHVRSIEAVNFFINNDVITEIDVADEHLVCDYGMRLSGFPQAILYLQRIFLLWGHVCVLRMGLQVTIAPKVTLKSLSTYFIYLGFE